MRTTATVDDRTTGVAADVWCRQVAGEPAGSYTVDTEPGSDGAASRASVGRVDPEWLSDRQTVSDSIALFARLARADIDELDPDRAVDLLDLFHNLEGPLAAAQARLLQAINAADIPKAQGAANSAAWLKNRFGIGGGQARRLAERSRLLRFLPQTSARLAAGRLSVRQADVLVDAAKSASYVDGDDVETSLLPLADDGDVDDVTFQRRVKAETARRDADAIDRDQAAAFTRRGLRLIRHRDGMVGIDGRLHPTAGAAFETALQAMMTPDPADTPDEAKRTIDQRRADALTDLVDTALRHGAPPATGGLRPQVHVHVDYDDLADRAGRNPLDDDTDPDHPANTGRTRQSDGTWRSGGVLDGYGPLGPHAMARLLCDADICRIVRRGPSQILDVGRATKRWPIPTRRAIIARDRHCRFPGCDRPAVWCQAHHVEFWDAHHGDTVVTNGVLLCSFHHHLVHDGGWTLTLDVDTGQVTVVTPDGSATYSSHTDRDPSGPAPPPGRHRPPRPA